MDQYKGILVSLQLTQPQKASRKEGSPGVMNVADPQYPVLVSGTSWLVPGPDDNETGKVSGTCRFRFLFVPCCCRAD